MKKLAHKVDEVWQQDSMTKVLKWQLSIWILTMTSDTNMKKNTTNILML